MSTEQPSPSRLPLMLLAWAWVAVPFGYGIYELFLKLAQLFSG